MLCKLYLNKLLLKMRQNQYLDENKMVNKGKVDQKNMLDPKFMINIIQNMS